MPAPCSGGCRCQAVRFECNADPVISAYCHCRDCQLSTGGAYATILLVPRSAFSLKGETRSYTVTGDSGGTVTRHFCPGCGTPLFSEISMNPDVVALKAGALDDSSWVRPALEVWTGSRQPWGRIPDGIPGFPRNPPS